LKFLYDKNKSFGKFKITIQNDHISGFSGTLDNKPLRVEYATKKNENVDYEKIVFGNWKASHIVAHNNKKEGEWVSDKGYSHKELNGDYQIYENKYHDYMVYKDMKIEKDRIIASYYFKKEFFIPVFSIGLIEVQPKAKHSPL
jgi:hypothetical protein